MRSIRFTLVLALSSSFLACGSDGRGEGATGGAAGSFGGGSGGTSSGGTGTGGSSTGGTGTGGSSTGGTGTGGSSTGGTGPGGSSTGGTGPGGRGTGGSGGTNVAEEARHPLELVLPRAAGTAPSSDPGTPVVPSGHRIFKAYPGIEYNIRAVVMGGSYPFTYTLSNAPTGMTIDENTGEITWQNPSGTATPTLTVTDAQGTTRSSPWTINVTTSGFRFVDDVNGNDNSAGTLASPWKTISKVKSSGVAGEIVIFRGGTYRTTGMATGGSDTWVRVEMNGAYHPVQWLAYPGETAVLDNDYVAGSNNGRFIRFSGSDQYPVYLDGFEVTHAWDKALQFGSGSCDYPVFRRLSIHDIAEAIDGANSAGIMTLTSNDDPTWYGVYQDNDFHDNAPGGIKQYSHQKVLWEDCLFRNSGGGPDLKAHVPRFEVRNCSFYGNGPRCGLFGNMHEGNGAGSQASGEVRYNRMLCEGNLAMNVNQDGQAAEIHLYRNTFVGTVSVAESNPANGPFHFARNVIVNDSTAVDKIDLAGPTIPGLVTYGENLPGTMGDGLVDANGNLQGSYVSFLGTRGYQVP
jgi:hypothetical protein